MSVESLLTTVINALSPRSGDDPVFTGNCNVDKYFRGCNMTIESWLHAMETWFISRHIHEKHRNRIIVTQMATELFDEVNEFESLPYEEFK